MAASEIPRCEFECIESPSPKAPQSRPSSTVARIPPHMWWSERMMPTARFATASGTCSKAVTHMFVASGIGAVAATSAIASSPGTGSSRYSSAPARRFATRCAVARLQAAFGSRRSGTRGNSSRRTWIASASRSGSITPPLSFSERNPYRRTISRASPTMASDVITSPQGSSPACLKNRYAANGTRSRTRPPSRSQTERPVARPMASRHATSIAAKSAGARSFRASHAWPLPVTRSAFSMSTRMRVSSHGSRPRTSGRARANARSGASPP